MKNLKCSLTKAVIQESCSDGSKETTSGEEGDDIGRDFSIFGIGKA